MTIMLCRGQITFLSTSEELLLQVYSWACSRKCLIMGEPQIHGLKEFLVKDLGELFLGCRVSFGGAKIWHFRASVGSRMLKDKIYSFLVLFLMEKKKKKN